MTDYTALKVVGRLKTQTSSSTTSYEVSVVRSWGGTGETVSVKLFDDNGDIFSHFPKGAVFKLTIGKTVSDPDYVEVPVTNHATINSNGGTGYGVVLSKLLAPLRSISIQIGSSDIGIHTQYPLDDKFQVKFTRVF